MCGVYQVAAFLTNNKHILTESNFENHFLFLKIFCSNYGITTFPDISRRVVHEHEVSWPGLHLVNSPFWWSLYFCMRRIGQCASTRPSFRVVFLKSQQEVVDSERIRILSTRSPAMEDISVCQRREILQMIQKILLRTGRSFLSKASLSDNLFLWSIMFSFGMPAKRITAWQNQHISLGLQLLNRKKLYLFVCLSVSSSAMLSSKSLLTGSVEVVEAGPRNF